MKLLIIEDEVDITKPLKNALEHRGYAVDVSNDGLEGFQMAKINEYDCILLDLNLPNMDGIDIAKKLRVENILTPILMLTARSRREEIWEGFENGTDDYLIKPFDFKELVFRIEALIKRNSMNKKEDLVVGSIVLDKGLMIVKRGKEEIQLNNKEFGILEYLIRNKGRLVSAEELLEHVWDEEIDMFSQTVRTNIKTLRQKIDPKKELIYTIRGKGYVIR